MPYFGSNGCVYTGERLRNVSVLLHPETPTGCALSAGKLELQDDDYRITKNY